MDGLLERELPRAIEAMSHTVIGCAIEVHRELGPGLLEKLYEDAMVYELKAAGLRVEQQVTLAVAYKDITLRGQQLDLLVGGAIVLELKSVEKLLEVHAAQLLSYCRAGGYPLGLLLNFNVKLMKDGLKRVFNERAVGTTMVPDLLSNPSSSSRSSR